MNLKANIYLKCLTMMGKYAKISMFVEIFLYNRIEKVTNKVKTFTLKASLIEGGKK